jgi:methyltransferase
MTLTIIVLSIVLVQRLSELVLARSNYRWAMQHGGREVGKDHYWLFIVLHGGWLVSFLMESHLRETSSPSIWPLLLAMIALAQILRYWAIRTLGKQWNTRIVVFERISTIRSGPYRYLKHPNYVAVALELFAIPALLGAWYSAIFFSAVNAALLLGIRIPAEEQALATGQSRADREEERR